MEGEGGGKGVGSGPLLDGLHFLKFLFAEGRLLHEFADALQGLRAA